MLSTLFQRMSVAALLMFSGFASAAADWTERSNENLRPGVTQISQEVYDLHMGIMIVVSLIGLLVFALIMYSAVAHRREKRPEPATFHEHLGLEIFWTVIPFIIVVLMAIPATKVLIEMDDTSASELTIKVTGYRWNWSYEYLNYAEDDDVGVFFFSNLATPMEQYQRPVLSGGLFPYGTAVDSVGQDFPEKDHNYMLDVDKPLVVPAGVKIRFLITADDVIHSFYVPDFAIKKDAIPGFVNEVWTVVPEDKTGTYFGQCTELCGKGHAFMPIRVDVLPRDEFDVWIAEQKEAAASGPDLTPFSSLDKAMEMGAEVYAGKCVVCHGANGEGGIGYPFAGTEFMTSPDKLQSNIDVLNNGRGGMPSFSAQLTPKEIAAVITYQRNAWGNDSGDLVQPEDVFVE